ncbi:MAG: hypothetical protein GF355_00645 [Candidatus Eisenbacteria bacterium]|nr:hypothetical protein [Candidatus Eisenbacteria bacterium]
MKPLSWLILVVFGVLFLLTVIDLPPRGAVDSPASEHVSPHYILRAKKEMETPNLVTAVLADYRAYDTLGETTVIFAGGLACLLILYRRHRRVT